MCKIIEFPVNRIQRTESNGYKNLEALFEICSSVTTCNFYLESVEELFRKAQITENEMLTLRRIGRQKRLTLANPDQEPQKAEKPGTYLYTPEMGQREPAGCQMEASLSYYGKHYFIDTPLELKGRGISFIRKYSAKDFTNPNNKKIGWNEYQVTKLAYEKLKSQYAISYKCSLD